MTQGQILQAIRDKNYILERLMRYENVESSSASDSEHTDGSDNEASESSKR